MLGYGDPFLEVPMLRCIPCGGMERSRSFFKWTEDSAEFKALPLDEQVELRLFFEFLLLSRECQTDDDHRSALDAYRTVTHSRRADA